MSKIRVTYIISDIDKALAFEWLAINLKEKFNLLFVLIGKSNSKFSIFLRTHSIEFIEISDEKHPSRLSKWVLLLFILIKKRPQVVHTHLWNANLLGLSSSWILRIKKRIYTRHHATIHYDQFPSGRKWDIMCNEMATHIIAISQNVKKILSERDKAAPEKIRLILHGFELDYFSSVSKERVESLRKKIHLHSEPYPVVGAISRYVQWKGLQYVIPAFKKILSQYPSAKLVLANAHGDYESTIKNMLNDLPKASYVEILFEDDLPALYKLFDIFVHAPVDPNAEAFGQTYIESLAALVPSVFTLSGIAPELIKHKYNAWVVDYKNSEQIAVGIETILSDAELRKHLVDKGERSVEQFSLDRHILALEKLYNE
jgi:glycosyltransferase involved in cell wall biosynthesis